MPVKCIVLRYSVVTYIITEFRENKLIAKVIGENLKIFIKNV